MIAKLENEQSLGKTTCTSPCFSINNHVSIAHAQFALQRAAAHDPLVLHPADHGPENDLGPLLASNARFDNTRTVVNHDWLVLGHGARLLAAGRKSSSSSQPRDLICTQVPEIEKYKLIPW